MNVSVLIPAYNAAKTIDATLQSVLSQSCRPMEILVRDDGSTDDTAARLERYEGSATIFRGPNIGISRGRNFLMSEAKGDVLAFIDSDDLWHPQYLETQCRMLEANPQMVASYSRYIGFHDLVDAAERLKSTLPETTAEILSSAAFFTKYNQSPVKFLPSFCCFRKRILEKMDESFLPPEISGVEDYYLANFLSLSGPVLYLSTVLGGYRFSPGSVSSNRTRTVGLSITAFELITKKYRADFESKFGNLVGLTLAARKRQYAKFLMGNGSVAEGRSQMLSAMRCTNNQSSRVKSLGLYLSTYLPRGLGPHWPNQNRDGK